MFLVHFRNFVIFLLVLLVQYSVSSKSHKKSYVSDLTQRSIGTDDECAKYDYWAEGCRNASCTFMCSDLLCKKNPEQCDSKCEKFCYDPCECTKNGCQYNYYDKMCRKHIKYCSITSFAEKSCLRGESVYVHDGGICQLPETTTGECSVEGIMAVNFNGKFFKDHDEIEYYGDANPKAKLLTKDYKKRSAGRKVLVDYDNEHEFFKSYAETDPSQKNQCIGIYINITKPGFYEAGFKVSECTYLNSGERIFSIRLNDYDIIPEFDIRSYANHFHTLHVIVKFFVDFASRDSNARVVYIDRDRTFPAHNTDMEFAVCSGKCEGARSNAAIVSAMYGNYILTDE